MRVNVNGKDSWKELETRVRTVASYIWNTPANEEEVHGVRCDAVLKPDSDRWILLEITRSNSLDKLRTDLSKFAAVKPALMAQGIHATCYFVAKNEPTASLIKTAEGQGVTALSVSQLEKKFFDYEKYHFVRNSKPFGSAVDILSGKKDELPYVPVEYNEVGRNQTHTLQDLADALCNRKRIILLGNYGTGKSRCVQEVFAKLGKQVGEQHLYPLAVDLRDHWGLKRGPEIIRRHCDDLGLSESADSILRMVDTGAITLLLDGFDEIASQVWSDDPTKLEEIRVQSLMGVADLLRLSSGGVLVVGREHYFNSQEEMFRCLGLESNKTLVVSSADEFSDEQMEKYLLAVHRDLSIPDWLPKRPLVSKMLASFDDGDLAELSRDQGEIDFWQKLLNTICKREARIHSSLDSGTIRGILLQLANLSRTKNDGVGPITLEDLNNAFACVVGRQPRDESSAMLQRLPVLGRVDPSSSDRQFLDTYILDGLRASAVIEMVVVGKNAEVMHEKWKHPLDAFGQSVLTQHIANSGDKSGYLWWLRDWSSSSNRVLAGDILTALLGIENLHHDFRNLVLSDSHLGIINLAETKVKNLRIVDSIINELTVGENIPSGLTIERCLIGTIRGLSKNDKLPEWLIDSTVERFDELSNVAKIRQSNLSKQQQIFVTVVHKTFFQPGSGRKEDAILRGLGATRDKKVGKRVLAMLIEEGILKTYRGKEGLVYVPARKHTSRMGKIIGQLKYSNDSLWNRLKE